MFVARRVRRGEEAATAVKPSRLGGGGPLKSPRGAGERRGGDEPDDAPNPVFASRLSRDPLEVVALATRFEQFVVAPRDGEATALGGSRLCNNKFVFYYCLVYSFF